MVAPQRRSDIARRMAWGAVVLALAALAPPAAAQVGPRLVSLYPLSRDAADAGDVEALLDVALHRFAQRSGTVALAAPLVARGACGPARTAAPDCLGRLAGEGLLVRALVYRSGGVVLVALTAVDGAGRVTGPVSTAVDVVIQNPEPLVSALGLLVDKVLAGDRQRARERGEPVREPPKAASAATEAPAPSAAAPPASAARPPPAEAAAAAPAADAKPDLRAAEPPRRPAVEAAPSRPPAHRRWMRSVGPWVAGAGAALLAGGVAVSIANHGLSSDLEDRLAAGRLTPGDLDDYDRVDRYNTLSTLLYASGGALTLGGIALWTAPLPRGPAVAGLSGRF